MTNTAHIVLCSCSSSSYLSYDWLSYWISILSLSLISLPHFSHLYLTSHFTLLFLSQYIISPMPPPPPISHHSVFHSPPLSTSLHPHLSPPLSSSVTFPLPVFFFFQLPFHLSFAFFHTHLLSHLHTFFFSLPGASVSFPLRHLPGGLATEHHHHGQLHEQVQPSVLVPATTQTHGVEPPWGLVPPQENRWEGGSSRFRPSSDSTVPLRRKS